MSKPWPPPPDLESIQTLVREADPERHIADGAPADEYEPEEEQIFAAIHHFSTGNLLAANVLPILENIWANSFSLDSTALEVRRPALLSLAQQIERFFGPAAQPQVRTL
jgi:hypothetical protein